MRFPSIDELEAMLEVIPDFVEDDITRAISMQGIFDKKVDTRRDAEMLLKMMRIKLKARERKIELYGENTTLKLEDLELRVLKSKEVNKLEEYGNVVEQIELQLLRELIEELENLLLQKVIRKHQIPNKKIDMLTCLYTDARSKRDKEVSEDEYMYIDIPGIPDEPFMQEFNVIETKGVTPFIAFDLPLEQGKVAGTVPVNSVIGQKMKEKLSNRDGYGDLTVNEEEHGLAPVNEQGLQEVATSLEIIDAEVVKEDRQSFMDKLENFVKRIREFFKKDGESR